MNNNVKTVQRQPLTAREIFMRYGAGIALAGRFSILLARGFGLVATPVYPVLRRAMLLYRPARQQLPSPAELFVSFTQEYARRHCLDSLPDDSLTALANTAG